MDKRESDEVISIVSRWMDERDAEAPLHHSERDLLRLGIATTKIMYGSGSSTRWGTDVVRKMEDLLYTGERAVVVTE